MNSPVILLGHSNGGQGAWHIASRYPQRVVAGFVLVAHVLKILSSSSSSCPSFSLHQVAVLCAADYVEVSSRPFNASRL